MLDKVVAAELDVLMDEVPPQLMSAVADIRHYINELLREISQKDATIQVLQNELLKSQPLPHHRLLEFPEPRGTTHGQLMMMQHEAETMHDNPPHDQPMG